MSNESHPPRLLFAAVSLRKGSGGIAELSRQVFRALLEMHQNHQIELKVQVLEEAGSPDEDDLLTGDNLRFIRWFGGHRWKFALSLVTANSDLQLMDHVGLARLPGLMPRFLRKNYVLLIHGIEIWDSHRTDYRRSAMKASLLIANSEYTAGKVRARYPNLPEIQVCHPGKDIPAGGRHAGDDGLHRPLGDLQLGPHSILIVGRLSAEQNHKGHDHLLEAMPLILQSEPDAQLVIAGEGDDMPRLQAKVKELELEDHVIFTGWVSEDRLHQLYEQCALFAMLSTGDGFGLVFLEAMAHGAVCVGLKTGSAAEIIEDGKTGVLVDRDDPRELAGRLTELLSDPVRRTKLGQAGTLLYKSNFLGMNHASRLQSILMEQTVTIH
jgi:phosphatidylinositol alpha-1,6-mannosyltransferase